MLPPEFERVQRLGGLVACGDGHDRFPVGRCGRLDRKPRRFAREERLADHGVLDEIDDVGREPPQVGARCLQQLLAQDSPRSALAFPEAFRVRRLQPGGDYLAHDIEERQPVTTPLDEIQPAQMFVKRIGGRLRAECHEHRLGDAAHDRYCVDTVPYVRLFDGIEQ